MTSGGVPTVALALLVFPSIVTSALYAYTTWYYTATLDTTLVIAVTYLGTVLAAMIMPWRLKGVWASSPLPKWGIAGIPVMSIVAAGFSVFLLLNLIWWLKDSIYGINNKWSLLYMGILYALAAAIWIVASVVRRRQGMPLEAVAKEIPVE